MKLETTTRSMVAPVYKYRKCPQTNGTSTVNLSTSNVSTSFEVSAQYLVNYSLAYLDFDMIIQGVAGATRGTSLHLSYLPFEKIELLVNDRLPVVSVDDVHVYTKVVRKVNTSQSEFREAGFTLPIRGAGANVAIRTNCWKPCSFLHSTQIPIGTDNELSSTGVVSGVHNGVYAYATGDAATISTAPVLANGQFNADLDQQFYAMTLEGNTVGTQNIIVRCRVPLSALSHTMFATQKELMFGTKTQLNLTWLPFNKIAWTSNGNGADCIARFNNVSQDVTSITINNLNLYIAEDTNPKNIEAMRDGLRSGMTLTIPYVQRNKLSAQAGSTYTAQSRYNNANGRALKRVYTIVTGAQETRKNSVNNNNTNGAMITGLQSQIFGKYIQDKKLNCALGEDWDYIKHLLKDTAVASDRHYKCNWFWLDNFSNSQSASKWFETDVDDSDFAVGLSEEVVYSVEMDKVNDLLNVYQYAVFERRLFIRDGVAEFV